MANPQLTVEITAKIDGLRDSFNKAVSEIKGLDGKTKSSLSSIDKSFGKLADDIEKNMKRSSNSISSASNSISKDLATAAVATSKSKNTYMDLGRVLQDLPYGFNGIQNNLTQLIPSAGLAGLAFTALVSAITFAQVGTDYWTRGLKENKKAIDSVKLSGKEYLDTLTQLNQTRIKGEQDSAKELAQLKILYSAYTNANLPLEVRKKSYKDIQEQYPSYFKNIKFEQEASTKTVSAYNSLTQAILATGRARAAVDLIAKNETRKLENEQKGIDLEKERIKLVGQRDALQAKAIGTLKKSTREGAGIADISRADNIQGQINENLKKQNNLKTDSNLLDANNLQLIKSVNVELTKGADILGSVGSLDKTKDIKETIKQGDQLAKSFQGGIKLGDLGNPTAQIIQVKPIEQAVSALDRLRASFGYTDDELIDFVSSYGVSLSQLETMTIDFNDKLSGILNNGIISTFGNLGSAIGSALANGTSVAEAAGQSLLSSLGGILTQLGELAIATGVGIQAIKTALKSLNPVVAITAGVALVALGSLVKGKASKIGGGGGSSSATPNRRFGGTTASIQSPSTQYTGNSNGPTSLKSMVAGGGTQTIILDARLGNDAIYLAAKRGEKQQSKV